MITLIGAAAIEHSEVKPKMIQNQSETFLQWSLEKCKTDHKFRNQAMENLSLWFANNCKELEAHYHEQEENSSKAKQDKFRTTRRTTMRTTLRTTVRTTQRTTTTTRFPHIPPTGPSSTFNSSTTSSFFPPPIISSSESYFPTNSPQVQPTNTSITVHNISVFSTLVLIFIASMLTG